MDVAATAGRTCCLLQTVYRIRPVSPITGELSSADPFVNAYQPRRRWNGRRRAPVGNELAGQSCLPNNVAPGSLTRCKPPGLGVAPLPLDTQCDQEYNKCILYALGVIDMSGGDGISVLQIRAHGCSYRIGERPQDIMARSRRWMLWLPWTAMAAISVLQFGYGVAVIAVQQPHHPVPAGAFWVLALWVIFQAGATAATPTLRRRWGIRPATTMSIGAVLSAIGPLTLSYTRNLGAAALGYSALCGVGAGMVYATCLSTVARWYPEQRGAKVSLVSGAFGCGAVPFVVLFAFVLHPATSGPSSWPSASVFLS